ncbi:MAG TPA: LamG domain-containing protein, partial [Candidatus Marinimicrobia bacterium]|nr:LamG domain-containing protein [Candidatus Neomarinimicrobiota bacterium]
MHASSMVFAQQDNSFNFQSDGASEDFVTVTSDPQLQPTAGMTLEAWVKPTEDPATYDMNGIISYLTLSGATVESGFAFLYKEGKWRFVVITDNANDVYPTIGEWPGIEIPYDGNTWTHIAGTYDGATAKIFKNGVEEGSYSGEDAGGSILWEDIATDFYIGKYLDANNAFKGSIDEVRLWEMANMENEIQASMNDVLDGDEGGLIGYWNFNDNQSSTVADHAEGVVPGTLTNNGSGDWDTDVFAPSGPCYDLELTEENFPYNHLADLGQSTNDYDFSNLLNSGGDPVNSADGNDY